MSGLMNKVKDALHSDKDKHTHSNTTNTTHTTHGAGTTGTTGTSGLESSSYATSGTHEGNLSRGTHEGAIGNTHTTTGAHGVGSNTLGSSTRGTTTSGAPEGTFGTHGHGGAAGRAMNAADPRIDSDGDGSRNMGANPNRSADTSRHTHNTLGSNTHATSGTHGVGSHTLGSNTHTTSATHGVGSNTLGSSTSGAPEGTFGTHSSRAANAADPRIDSDRDHRAAHTTGHTTGSNTLGSSTHGTTGMNTSNLSSGPGPAPNTAGIHKSDMMNKVDPRIDSDMDGSKTVGGNKTYGA